MLPAAVVVPASADADLDADLFGAVSGDEVSIEDAEDVEGGFLIAAFAAIVVLWQGAVVTYGIAKATEVIVTGETSPPKIEEIVYGAAAVGAYTALTGGSLLTGLLD